MNRTTNFPWLVVHDPQQIYTGPFHQLDLQLTAKAGYWPEGIIFQHKRTLKRLIFQDGRLIELTAQETAHDTQR